MRFLDIALYLVSGLVVGTAMLRAEVPADKTAFAPTAEQREWWAFQPVVDPGLPSVVRGDWLRDDLDRFVLAELEARALDPSAPAERRQWLRRVTIDLTGLPPAPDDVALFLADLGGDAEEKVVDRLLASRAYAERQARHWLDVVRYADFHDGQPAARNPICEPMEAWRYRDWVVKAFDADLPFDRFISHHIAGDLLPAPDGRDEYPDGLIATTFLVNGAWDRGDADKEKMVSDMVDDQIDTIGKAFLSLGLGCARCHDHKYDPVSTADYYALAGIFYSTRMLEELGTKGGEITLRRRPLVPAEEVERHRRLSADVAAIDAALALLDKRQPQPPPDDTERVGLVERRNTLLSELPSSPPMTLAVSEGGVPGGLFPGIQDVPIHLRGSYTHLGEVVPRRMPEFLRGPLTPPIANGSGRRELAAWIGSGENPLATRSIVNRIWQWHFGTGLVATPNNFGLLSAPPSHPLLLDWLASRFVEGGWSLKKLHRRIVLSATYRQSSLATPAAIEFDPANRWLGRFSAHRIDAESLRDALLVMGGSLTGGRPDTAVTGSAGPGKPATADVAAACRSLYLQTCRWDRSGYSVLFDAANCDASVDTRSVSTVAPQALFLINDPFVKAMAAAFAERLFVDVPSDVAGATELRIDRAWLLAYGREPAEDEQRIAREIVTQGDAQRPPVGWIDLAHVLLASNEFAYLD
ncbi:MAG: DUF1553 domain-containing protein [Planctomycetota bacterium]|nr:MAG: DUF1553 domain-containing protein [Planctomycetota bacterium]